MIKREESLPSVRPGAGGLVSGVAARCKECRAHGAGLCDAIRLEGTHPAGASRLHRYDKGRLIVEQDTLSGFVGVIRRGYARQSRMQMDGKRILLGLAVPGDLVLGRPDQPSACDLEAATDLEICLYESCTLTRLLSEDSLFRQKLLQIIDAQYHRFLEGLWRYGALNSRERIIAFLVTATGLMPTEPLPDGSVVLTMEIERRDWADLTNTAVETISRTLRYLEEKALITCLSPNRFHIHDPMRLALIAGVEPSCARKSETDHLLVRRGRRLTAKARAPMTPVNAARSSATSLTQV